MVRTLIAFVLAAVAVRLLQLASVENFEKNGEVAVYYLGAVWLFLAYIKATVFSVAAWSIQVRRGWLLIVFTSTLYLIAYFVVRSLSQNENRFDVNASFLFVVSWFYIILSLAFLLGDGMFGSLGKILSRRRMGDDQ